ncbi:MAG: hypothetical protein JKY32_03670 [Rhizobiales bacterium]|nr:hypothetical protein [Hyphomicrobiales bacterium]
MNNKAPDHAQNGNRGLLAAGIFAFAALLATGFFMTLSQGNIMFLKILIARIPGCGGLF